jgi:hypothetical protein
MAYDFGSFYNAAMCFIQGQSPYSCAGFFYPLPTLFLFLPFTAFPYPIARALWWLILLTAFVLTMKRRALWFMLYIPALQAFYLGQLDLLLFPLIAIATGPAMALLTLKPQLIWLYLPLWLYISSPRQRRAFLLVLSILWGASFVAWPLWPLDFLATTRRLSQAAYASPSLWGGSYLPWPLVIGLGLLLLRFARDKWAAVTAINPAIIAYDLTILLPKAAWWLVPLSWLTQYLSNLVGIAMPHVLLAVAVALYPDNGRNPITAIRRRGQALASRAGRIIPGVRIR